MELTCKNNLVERIARLWQVNSLCVDVLLTYGRFQAAANMKKTKKLVDIYSPAPFLRISNARTRMSNDGTTPLISDAQLECK